MKKWLAYMAALAVALLFSVSPFRGTEIAKLAPVEVVWLSQIGDFVYLETDMSDAGMGKDVSSALQDMKAKAPGIIFMETANYLIVQQGDEKLLEQMFSVLRPSCMVCICEEKPALEDSAAFLSVHEPGVTLRQLRAASKKLPLLKQGQGRLELIE